MRRFALLAFMLVSPMKAFAQDATETDPDSTRTIKYKERTEIDFEEVDVSGELVKPQGQLISTVRQASFNPMIRVRTEFNEEMRQSVDEVN